MNNKITKQKNNLVDKSFDEELNQITDYTPPSYTRQLKFNSKEGKILKHIGEIDGNGDKIWEEIDKSIDIHIVNAGRHNVSTSDMDKDVTKHYYSTETSSFTVDIYDKDTKEFVESCKIADAKAKYKTKMTKVAYVYYNDEAYKMYFGGGKLGSLIKYMQVGNPAKVMTTLSVGNQYDTSYGKLYNLVLTKGKELDKDLVLKRSHELQDYLKSLGSNSVPVDPSYDNETTKINDVKIEGKEIDINDVPFISEDKQTTLEEAKKNLG